MSAPDDCPHCRGTGIRLKLHHVIRANPAGGGSAETYLCGAAASPGTVFVVLHPGLDGAITATQALSQFHACRACETNLARVLERTRRDTDSAMARLEAREERRAARAANPKKPRVKAAANPLAEIGAMASATPDPRQIAADARLAAQELAKPAGRTPRGVSGKRGKSKPMKRPRGPGGVVLNRRRRG